MGVGIKVVQIEGGRNEGEGSDEGVERKIEAITGVGEIEVLSMGLL